MFLYVDGLEINVLEKSKQTDENLVMVDIIANHLTEDTDNETVLKEAFDQKTVQEFLDIGIIDWWHKSKDANISDSEKAQSVIGIPKGFRWVNGKPVVTAGLYKKNPIVQEMIPSLESSEPAFAASIGGGKVVMKVNTPDGEKRIIPKIKWDHLAIAPRNSVINRMPGPNITLLQKANNLLFTFPTMDSFKSDSIECFAKEEDLKKALLAPSSVSDLDNTSGGVVTKQDLEKGISNLSLSEDEAIELIDTILDIKNGEIPDDNDGFINYFTVQKKADLGKKYFSLINKSKIGAKK